MDEPSPPSPESLLAEAAWIRSLAGHLLQEPADADDVAQETWLAALRSPPRRGGPLRPWLRAVLVNAVRRLRRNEGRRQSREREVSPPERLPSAAELVERLDVLQEVGAAVRGLEEPYRSAVLLRYFEGLTPSDIAARQALTAEAVRKRLERGRERLRERLAERLGGRDPSRRLLGLLVAGRLSPPERLAGSSASRLGPATKGLAAGAAVLAGGLAAGSIAVAIRGDGAAPTSAVGRLSSVDSSTPGRPWILLRPPEESPPPSGGTTRSPIAVDRGATPSASPDGSRAVEPGEGVAAAGFVVDPVGRPVPGASVWVMARGSRFEGSVWTRTDAEGGFRLEGLSLDREIGAFAEGWAPSILQSVRGRPGETWPVQVQLERPGTEVSGSVVDPSGAPIAGARFLIGSERGEIVFLPDTREGRAPPPLPAVSGAGGLFRRESVPPGRQPIQSRAPGFGTTTMELDVPPGGLRGVRVVLAPEAGVVGRLLSREGRPVEGARVRSGDGASFAGTVAPSDADGRFEVRGLPGGSVHLLAEHPEAGVARAELRLQAGSVRAWEPTLQPTPRIRGVLLDESGDPLEGWTLSLRPQGREGEISAVETGRQGRFLLPHLAEAAYDLVVHAPGAWMELPFLVERGLRPGDGERPFRLRDLGATTGTIVGRVVRPDGEPAAGTMVTGWHLDQETHSWYGITPDAESGRFEIARIPPGRLRVAVRSARWGHRILGAKAVSAGGRLDLGTIRLEAPAVLRGSLLGATDEDLERLRIRILDSEDEPVGPAHRTGRSYRSPPLGSGRYRLLVDGDFLESVRETFDLGVGEDRSLDVRLAPAGLVRVLLLAREDLSETWTWCRALDASGRARWTWGGRVPPEGREVRVSLAPGDYELRVESTAVLSAEVPISVRGYAEDASVLRVLLR
ncbi:MAG: sigma-70 family RNA polymerase sigma factor [Planctomycetes bacterium]|nr:sigma-70 family RNA polymerase sigma factor [Planctomycetota bacterium]